MSPSMAVCVTPADGRPAEVCLCGHIGVGHSHSHSGFVQDDSGGFATLVTLLCRAYPVRLGICRVIADLETATVTVWTEDGGCGAAWCRRGITPFEAALLERVQGADGRLLHRRALEVFGRVYGNGVSEVALAFETALGKALLDTFVRVWPGCFERVDDDRPHTVDSFLHGDLVLNGVPTAVLLVLNAGRGGTGPDENCEGNACLGPKGELMHRHGLNELPTIILESKAYVPELSDTLLQTTLWVRYNEQQDNSIVGEALYRAALHLGLDVRCSSDVFRRGSPLLPDAVRSFGDAVADIGRQLASSTLAEERVRFVAELARLVCEDAGGVVYMDDKVFSRISSCGLWPGTAAVLSTLQCAREHQTFLQPVFEQGDVERYLAVCATAVPLIRERAAEALAQIRARRIEPVR